jgi:hypothetical protein
MHVLARNHKQHLSIPWYPSASDRPDVVARVYNLKKNEIVEDIQKRQIFWRSYCKNPRYRISEA